MAVPRSSEQSHRWIVSQLTAREHYAVARAFHAEDHLRVLYTDIWCRYGAPLVRRLPGRARGLAARHHDAIPSHRVRSFTLQTLADSLIHGMSSKVSRTDRYQEYVRAGQAFAERVATNLERTTLDPDMDWFFGYDTGCLETLQMLRAKGIRTVVDQIDPARVEEQIVLEEAQKWPGWDEAGGPIPDAYFERIAQEWELASVVLVNSEWSKNALLAQGVPAAKIAIVPLAYEGPARPAVAKAPNHGTLSVLWLGTVNLRKGIQYLIRAADLLRDRPIRFTVAGDIGISAAAVATAPRNMSFIGRVTRDRVSELYRQCHVFVLPTISDGFAITQIEAMAHALPVITTPNCGDVVSHGEDGLVVPARDARALADAITQLDADREYLREMSLRALAKSRLFSLARYRERVESAATQTALRFLAAEQ